MSDLFGRPELFLRRGAARGDPNRIVIVLYQKNTWGGAHYNGYHWDHSGAIWRGTATPDKSNRSSTEIFKLTLYVPHRNTEAPYDISVFTNSLMEKFLKSTVESLMSHANLKYGDIRVGNKGACLNFNLLRICSDTNCSYRHT